MTQTSGVQGTTRTLAVPALPGMPAAEGTRRRTGSIAGETQKRWLAATDPRLRALWQTSLDALLVVDDDRRYVCVNGPATQLLGAPLERVLGRRIEDFTAPENREVLESLWAELRSEGTQHGAYEVLRGDGSRGMAEYRAIWDFGPEQHLIVARALDPWAGWAVEEGRPGHETGLTPREREVIQLAADGRSTPEIAGALFLSPGTVKTHFQHIYEKLDVHDRASAVAECLRRRLIE